MIRAVQEREEQIKIKKLIEQKEKEYEQSLNTNSDFNPQKHKDRKEEAILLAQCHHDQIKERKAIIDRAKQQDLEYGKKIMEDDSEFNKAKMQREKEHLEKMAENNRILSEMVETRNKHREREKEALKAEQVKNQKWADRNERVKNVRKELENNWIS